MRARLATTLSKWRALAKKPRVREGLLLLPALGVLLWGLSHFRGFVQDDAFISLRYARNLVQGHGLVFNPGERTEGFTNLLWTLFGALMEVCGLPTVRVWQGLGQASAILLVVVCFALGRDLANRAVGFAAALVMAASATLQLWSVSALENTPFAALVLASLWLYGRGRERSAYLMLAVAQWVRPEATLAAAVLLAVTARSALKSGRSWGQVLKALLPGVTIFALCVVPLFVFRRWYYEAWVPNTFLVKGSATFASHHLGLVKLQDYLSHGAASWHFVAAGLVLLPSWAEWTQRDAPPEWRRVLVGVSWGLPIATFLGLALIQLYLFSGGYLEEGWSPLPALRPQVLMLPMIFGVSVMGALGARQLLLFPESLRRHPALACLIALWLGYLYYYVRVGGDAMRLHRLLLPGIAAQVVLAVVGLERAIRAAPTWAAALARVWQPLELAAVRGALFGIAGCWVLAVIVQSVNWTRSQLSYNAVETTLDKCQGEAGRMLQAAAEKHDFVPVALAQDLGKMTVEAPDVRFIDSTGLITREVAEMVREYRYNPYWRYLVWKSPEARARITEMEERLRTLYTESMMPDYAILNVDISADQTPQAQAAVKSMDVNYWRTATGKNDFFYRWPIHAYFSQNYVLEKVFTYSTVAYLSVWRRKDRPSLLP